MTTPESVAAYLRAHPEFLANRPELYRALDPPARVHGETLADHMAAMLEIERAHAEAMAERADGVLAAGRATAGMARRVQEAVIALIRAQDPVECITAEFPALLAIDSASLCLEAPWPGTRALPPGQVARLLGTRAVLFRPGSGSGGADAQTLHGEAARLARHEALLRLPGEGPAGLIALATRDDTSLDPAQGLGPLAFLARAVAAAMKR